MSAKPTRWNHYIDIGHNLNKSINSADFWSSFHFFAANISMVCSLIENGYFSNVNFRQRKDVVTSKTRLGMLLVPFTESFTSCCPISAQELFRFRHRVRTHATRPCSLRWFFEDNLLTFVRWFWREESTIWKQCTGGDSLCFGTIGLHFYGSIWNTL